MDRSAIDAFMMQRCVELSTQAVERGELPFACVIARDGEVIAEASNRVARDGDVTRHAEMVAIAAAQRTLGRTDLSDCTVYCNVEPCPMCAFPMRETKMRRVVYAISSPIMGGRSRWNVLGDDAISRAMPEVFGDAPEVVAGLHYPQASAVWKRWNPLFWAGIRLSNCLGRPEADGEAAMIQHATVRFSFRRWLASMVHRGRAASPVVSQAADSQP